MGIMYKLLNCNIGLITTREHELISDTLKITFIGAPQTALAIFEREDGESAYRNLSDGACELNKTFLRGSIKVTVTRNSSANSTKWVCEGINAIALDDGNVLVCPNDTDIQKRVVALEIDIANLNDNLTSTLELLAMCMDDMNKKLEKRIVRLEELTDDPSI